MERDGNRAAFSMIGKRSFSARESEQALALGRRINLTLQGQSAGWKERSIFERQWLKRAFAKRAGRPVEAWLDTLERLEEALREKRPGGILRLPARDGKRRYPGS